MTLVPWQPEPEPFGNATGFDFVALDVYRTIVFDLRSVPDDRIVSFAVRGPMSDHRLPDGMISTAHIPAHMAGVADDYMRYAGASLAETGTPVEET